MNLHSAELIVLLSLETHLYMIPKSHPTAENRWIEWRLSFSLVEKEIFVSIMYLYRKVYLFCKKLTSKWKKKYSFHSYELKTVFLWTYENWEKSGKGFTENDLLSMMVDVFSYLLACYEDRNIPMYFIPELNLLEQYPITTQEELLNCLQGECQHEGDAAKEKRPENNLVGQSQKCLILEIRKFANQTSLTKTILERFTSPFPPIVRKARNLQTFVSREIPSHQHIFYLFKEKIVHNGGILKDEDKPELLCELYITFLFLLHERVFNISNLNNVGTKCIKHDYFQHILYFLMVFGGSASKDNITFDFIMNYCESINEFFNDYHPLDKHRLSILIFEPFSSLDKEKRLEIQAKLREEYGTKDLPEKWLNGDLDNYGMSLMHKMNQLGNREKSEKLQNLIEEKNFWQTDLNFKLLVDDLNKHLSQNFSKRCLKEIKTVNINISSQKSYFLKHLVYHMCEMYNYGFTNNKFDLPRPAVYISYLAQLLLNMKYNLQHEINSGNKWKFIKPYDQQAILGLIGDPLCKTSSMNENIHDQWGFTVKESSHSYVDYSHRKRTLIPFTWTLIGHTDKCNKKFDKYFF